MARGSGVDLMSPTTLEPPATPATPLRVSSRQAPLSDVSQVGQQQDPSESQEGHDEGFHDEEDVAEHEGDAESDSEDFEAELQARVGAEGFVALEEMFKTVPANAASNVQEPARAALSSADVASDARALGTGTSAEATSQGPPKKGRKASEALGTGTSAGATSHGVSKKGRKASNLLSTGTSAGAAAQDLPKELNRASKWAEDLPNAEVVSIMHCRTTTFNASDSFDKLSTDAAKVEPQGLCWVLQPQSHEAAERQKQSIS